MLDLSKMTKERENEYTRGKNVSRIFMPYTFLYKLRNVHLIIGGHYSLTVNIGLFHRLYGDAYYGDDGTHRGHMIDMLSWFIDTIPTANSERTRKEATRK
mgnify:FL=1